MDSDLLILPELVATSTQSISPIFYTLDGSDPRLPGGC